VDFARWWALLVKVRRCVRDGCLGGRRGMAVVGDAERQLRCWRALMLRSRCMMSVLEINQQSSAVRVWRS
jgi:hypothetical protein